MTTQTSPRSAHWHILGLGSVGGLFACRMVAAGIPVVACPSPSLANATVARLTLEENGHFTDFDIPLSHNGPIEQLLLTTKAQQSEHALRALHDRLTPEATVVVLQNGLGVHEWLITRYPGIHVIAATTTEGANRPTSHHIRHAGHGTTWLGPWRAEDASAADAVFAQWSALALDMQFDPDIAQRLWEKLVMNCAINPLTALLDCRNGELEHHAETRHFMQAIVNEVAAVMCALGRPADAAALYEKVLAVARRTGANVSSMLQDHRAGRDTEIDFINGYVARTARTLNVETPVNAWLGKQVQEKNSHTPETLFQAIDRNAVLHYTQTLTRDPSQR